MFNRIRTALSRPLLAGRQLQPRIGSWFVIVVALFSGASNALAEPPRLTDENVPFFYEARAAVPTPDHKLARIVSSDYARARDEFTRHDLMEQIRPVLESRTQQAGATKEVMLRIGGRLGDYNFSAKAFPTGFSDGSFIPFDNSYAVTFTNAEAITELPVGVDKARSLSGSLRSNRRTVNILYGVVVGAEETSLRYSPKKTVKVRITRIEVSLASGVDVGVKDL